ncbi:hypothetical protein HY030_04335 [Candidatus Gottesmanbacteria bacterium]|nr:hypothetical protein [Candidatus Gottesmanbacteria bacterium]
MKKATLTIFAGPMFSGKTTKLIYLTKILKKLGQKVLVAKPSIDTRYTKAPKLASHDAKTVTAVFVDMNKPEDLLKIVVKNPSTPYGRSGQNLRYDHVILDELNFFHKTKTPEVVKKLLKKGVSVTGSGLAYDYRRKPFGPTLKLIKMADYPIWQYAICQKCGAAAEHTERVAGGKEQVVVAGTDMYIASCRKCHKVYTGR